MNQPSSALARLGVTGLAPLVVELARRIEDGSPVARITVRGLDDNQRASVADLLGRDLLPGRTVRIALHTLLEALNLTDIGQLRLVVETIAGPLGDRRAVRDEQRERRTHLWAWCAEQAEGVPLLTSAGGVARWMDVLRQVGVRGGEHGEVFYRHRIGQAMAVLRGLPLHTPISLAAFADDRLADPHALDRGSVVEGLVLDALAIALEQPRPRDAEAVRQLWEQVGVVPDPLSSTVTVLGLRPSDGGVLADWLRHCADSSEPAVVTLSQLRRWPLAPLRASEVTYVVENPSVLSHAASEKWMGSPIISSSGRPTIAVVTLIRQLGAGGATCRQHADFDTSGLGITAWMAERAGTIPWLMTTEAYGRAIAVERQRVPLESAVGDTPWEPSLGPAMRAAGVAVYEEELRLTLLDAMA
ncbi:MAG TPA: TIGR02679 family protein [Acidimicrobiales bacterium]|jgi:uncharacterized protein (TIGR02679 family)|nr:TIGR02679 family protein [Acidimicrobiales bacterium]